MKTNMVPLIVSNIRLSVSPRHPGTSHRQCFIRLRNISSCQKLVLKNCSHQPKRLTPHIYRENHSTCSIAVTTCLCNAYIQGTISRCDCVISLHDRSNILTQKKDTCKCLIIFMYNLFITFSYREL